MAREYQSGVQGARVFRLRPAGRLRHRDEQVEQSESQARDGPQAAARRPPIVHARRRADAAEDRERPRLSHRPQQGEAVPNDDGRADEKQASRSALRASTSRLFH